MLRYVYLLAVILIALPGRLSAQVDVVHYTIRIESSDLLQKTIHAGTSVRFTSSGTGFDTLHLDLLKLNIDSVRISNSSTSFFYNDTLLSIPLPTSIVPGDTETVDIYYSGAPQKDPSGWGGFYFSGNNIFNMGVGFDSNPHNFGRSWFPCRDNFTDRASYLFEVVTDTGFKAFCNGVLSASTVQPGNKIRWTYTMDDPIPTYLASVAIAPYITWQRNYQGLPVEIACRASDSLNVSQTFQHLDTVLRNYIEAYGPYRFDKVGYCLVPFNSGAMEHATSIHIGSSYVNGTLSYESLWVHELAHMWWGDWVTCATEGDMWLNEGFATFNEAYINERLYGTSSYRNTLRSNHRRVLQFAHITDNGYRPLINIPHDYTYGPTVYNKGAEVARTLRHFMGDSLFFAGCRHYMDSLGNGNASSYDLRDALSNSSGIGLTDFFEDWVFTPGFPHFKTDSVIHIPGTPHHYQIYVRQEGRGNNHTYRMNIPFTLSNGSIDTTVILYLDSATGRFDVSLPFAANYFILDRMDYMADAVIDYERTISSTGSQTFPETFAGLNVIQAGLSPFPMRIEHHYAAPDAFKNPVAGLRLSDYHYWRIDGLPDSTFLSKCTFSYNGSGNANAGFMDNTLITGNEDSLVLLYRSDAGDDWIRVSGYSLSTGNKFDKIGSITVDTVRLGEYTLGYRTGLTSLPKDINASRKMLEAWPNPFHDSINVRFNSTSTLSARLLMLDSNGKVVYERMIRSNEDTHIQPGIYAAGVYFLQVMDGKTKLATETIVLQGERRSR